MQFLMTGDCLLPRRLLLTCCCVFHATEAHFRVWLTCVEQPSVRRVVNLAAVKRAAANDAVNFRGVYIYSFGDLFQAAFIKRELVGRPLPHVAYHIERARDRRARRELPDRLYITGILGSVKALRLHADVCEIRIPLVPPREPAPRVAA